MQAGKHKNEPKQKANKGQQGTLSVNKCLLGNGAISQHSSETRNMCGTENGLEAMAEIALQAKNGSNVPMLTQTGSRG